MYYTNIKIIWVWTIQIPNSFNETLNPKLEKLFLEVKLITHKGPHKYFIPVGNNNKTSNINEKRKIERQCMDNEENIYKDT